MSTITINGKVAPTSPYELAINARRRIVPPTINGITPMSIINGVHRPPVPSGTQLYLPLWHPLSSPSVFKSLDKNAHTCTKTGTIWTPQGGSFDGGDDVISVANAAVLNPTTAITFVSWVKPSTGYTTIDVAGTLYKSPVWGHYINAPGGTSTFSITIAGTARYFNIATVFPVNVWTCVFCSYDGTTAVVDWGSVDGTITNKVSDATYAGAIGTSTNPVWIGNLNAATRGLLGLIGDNLMVSRALTTAEKSQFLQATRWRYQ